jgi:hypothetical protein
VNPSSSSRKTLMHLSCQRIIRPSRRASSIPAPGLPPSGAGKIGQERPLRNGGGASGLLIPSGNLEIGEASGWAKRHTAKERPE